MYICPNCNKVSETPVAFCSACGSRMVEQPVPAAPAYQAPVTPEPAPVAPAYQAPVTPEPAPAAPAYQAPAYQAPAAPVYQAPAPQYAPPVYQAEVVNKPHKAKVIVGMALGIGGLVFAALGLLYTLIFAGLEGALAFGYSIGFGIFSLPMSLVGMIMSRGNIAAGDTSSMSNVGKNLGLVGTILTAVMFFIGFVALLAVG